MKKYYQLGLIGHHIQHSLSPVLHCYWLNKYQLNGEYQLLERGNGKEDIEDLLTQQRYGLNITAPYKEKVGVWMTQGPERRLQAVNTLTWQAEGHYKAINTDFLAAKDFLKAFPRQASVVILGNGGTARAVIEALYQQTFVKVQVIQRQQKKWPEAYRSLLAFQSWAEANTVLSRVDLIINTVPGLRFTLPRLLPHTVIWDYTYGDKASNFLSQAYTQGRSLVPGIEFLIRQAQYSFYEWFSIFPEVTKDLRMRLCT